MADPYKHSTANRSIHLVAGLVSVNSVSSFEFPSYEEVGFAEWL